MSGGDVRSLLQIIYSHSETFNHVPLRNASVVLFESRGVESYQESLVKRFRLYRNIVTMAIYPENLISILIHSHMCHNQLFKGIMIAELGIYSPTMSQMIDLVGTHMLNEREQGIPPANILREKLPGFLSSGICNVVVWICEFCSW